MSLMEEMNMIKIYTIGFTGKSASEFFDLLEKNRVTKIIDTRINNSSQLSGYAKGKDLEYFAKKISNIEYEHNLDFAPTKGLLSLYRDKKISWDEYAAQYVELIKSRNILKKINIDVYNHCCLLCSEHLPQQCHRRLLGEYLKSNFSTVEIIHLK